MGRKKNSDKDTKKDDNNWNKNNSSNSNKTEWRTRACTATCGVAGGHAEEAMQTKVKARQGKARVTRATDNEPTQ